MLEILCAFRVDSCRYTVIVTAESNKQPANKRDHTMNTYSATRINSGEYFYRGFQIVKVSLDSYVQWNIEEKIDYPERTDWVVMDACDTLREAKHLIDAIKSNR